MHEWLTLFCLYINVKVNIQYMDPMAYVYFENIHRTPLNETRKKPNV